jgi:hypothetical protein
MSNEVANELRDRKWVGGVDNMCNDFMRVMSESLASG